MSDEQVVSIKIKELQKELKIDADEQGSQLHLQKEIKKISRMHSFYKVFGMIILAFSAIMTVIALIVDEGKFLGIEIKPHFYGAFTTVVMTSMIFITIGKLELKRDRLITLMFLRGLKNDQNVSKL